MFKKMKYYDNLPLHNWNVTVIIYFNIHQEQTNKQEQKMNRARHKVTVKDVARECGLSVSTVAYILSGNTTYKFKEETKNIIYAAAKRIGYQPNMAARALSSKKNYAIGVLFYSVRDHYYAELVDEIQTYLEDHGYASRFSFWGHEDGKFVNAYNSVIEHGVDGIICGHYDKAVMRKDIPTVIYQADKGHFDSICLDVEMTCQLSLEYLKGLGHHKIGFIGDPRYRNFKGAMKKFNLRFRDDWVFKEGSGFMDTGVAAMQYFLKLKDRPTAIICSNDARAMGAIGEVHRNGFLVPRDFSFIGMDNIVDSEFIYPRLTTFDFQHRKISHMLADVLLNRIKNPEAEIQTLKMSPTLIIRDSCGRVKEK